jgi:mono/diheme cytochrome c family protein
MKSSVAMKSSVNNPNAGRLSGSLVCLAVSAFAVAGCGKPESPRFHLNMVAVADAQLPPGQQQELSNVLEALYGTPDDPFALPDTKLDLKKIQVAAGPVRSDQFGRETGLYRRHCGHCHGTTGDGQGPTAMLLNPYPRDYRQGKFKFKSTDRAAKPTDHDLELIVRQGIAGTAMPSFNLLPDAQIKALVEYVKYLSMRGQTEIDLINAFTALGEGEQLQTTRAVLVDEIIAPLTESWTTAVEKIVQPEKKPEGDLAASVEKGRELFYGTAANCVKCHGPSALGDGQTNDYDDWTKPLVEMAKRLEDQQKSIGENKEMPAAERNQALAQIAFAHEALHDDSLPPRNIIPRNLRQGVYRGGRRPLDIFRRISAGINGVPMPGVGPASPGAQGTLTPEQVWNLVDYVLSLPYEPISEPPRQQQLRVSQVKNF